MEMPAQSSTDAAIAHAMAVKAAEGLDAPQDWTAALDHLARAAVLGSRLAQAELAALSGDWPLALDILATQTAPDAPWSQWRSAIDLAPWLAPPEAKWICQKPRIAVVNDIASAGMCAWLIARARDDLQPARIYDSEDGHARADSGRSNTLRPFGPADRDLVFATLRARIAAVTGLPVGVMERPHILHYAVGEQFLPHFDTPEDANAPAFRQRVLTFLVALNDGYEGGETVFPRAGGRWKGRQGGGLFFWNVEPDGSRDRQALHAGRPVTQGEKWLLSQWIGRPEG